MIRVERSTVLDAPADVVWRVLRDFNSHATWHPAIASSRIEGGEPSDRVGAVRAFRLVDGGFLREQLIDLSDREMSLTYCLIEAPVPLDGYVATLRLRPVTHGDRSFLQWQSRFDAPPARAAELSRLVGETIYENGLRALQARLGRAGQRAAPPVPVAAPRAVTERLPSVTRETPRVASGADTIEAAAIVVARHGGPEVLRPAVVAVAPPGAGEVRIRHAAIGVNMADVHGRAGQFGLDALPAVPGLEASGTVIDLGAAVGHLRAGDRVVYAGPPPGAYAQARTMPAAGVLVLPADIEETLAAAAFLKGIAADLLVRDVHAVQPGEAVLVHAAAGGLGLILCAWAARAGARVIGVVSTDAKAEAAARAGCDRVVVRAREDLGAAVRDATGGRGVDVVYDPIGASTFDASVAALAVRGHLVSFGQVSGPVGARDIDALAGKSLRLSRPNFAHFTRTADELAPRAARVFDALRRGVIRPLIDARLPLADAAEAHRRLEARENVGAIVLVP